MTTETELKQWQHTISVCDWDITIIFREDNFIAVNDGEPTFHFFPLDDKEAIKESEQFRVNVLTDDLQDYLHSFFWWHLNSYPFLDDPFITDGDYGDHLKIEYNRCRFPNKPHVDFEDFLKAAAIYYNLPDTTIFIYEDYDEVDSTEPAYENLLKLIGSVVTISGENLEYNDGAYDRASGYSDIGRQIYIESEHDTELTPIEFMNYIISNPEPIKKAKRTIISWLQQYQPLGIRNLKKLDNFLFNS